MSPAASSAPRPALERQPFDPADLEVVEAALDFAAAHPAGGFPRDLQRRFLTELCTTSTAVIDLRVGEAPVLLAVVIDTCDNAGDAASFEVLGWRAGAPEAQRALELSLDLAIDFARAGARACLEAGAELSAEPSGARLERRGFRPAYHTYGMIRGAGPWPSPGPLPEGLRFGPLAEAEIPAYRALVVAAFAGLPGAHVPPEEAFGASLRRAPIPPDVLRDREGRLHAFVAVQRHGEVGDLASLGRDPSARGRGLGPHLVDRGLGRLVRAGARRFTLDVAADNPTALDLYRRFGFEVATECAMYRLDLRGS